jgi:hypothetical protein
MSDTMASLYSVIGDTSEIAEPDSSDPDA